MTSLRCGRIKYTNDLPIYAAFDAGAIAYPGTLHADVPAQLNAMLLGGELDFSPISAFTWAANSEELVLLPDLCIGARDEVVSVVLVSATPPALLDGARVFVSNESASGRALLRVILERRYGVRAQFVDEPQPFARACEGDPTLLIGDCGDRRDRAVPGSQRLRSWDVSGTNGRASRRSLPSGPRGATLTRAIRSPCAPACTR